MKDLRNIAFYIGDDMHPKRKKRYRLIARVLWKYYDLYWGD